MVSQSSPHFLNPVTVILLILFGVLPISAGAQQLTCSPTPVQFRDTVIGQSESLPVVLTNTGSTNVTVSEVNSGLAAFRVSSLKLPSTLGPGESLSFSLAFAPTTPGWQGEMIWITSTLSAKSFCLETSGRAVSNQDLTLSPTALNFGNVPAGTSSTLSIVVTNSSYYIDLSQPTTSAGFTVSGPTMPAVLLPTQSITFKVQFTPKSVGVVTGSFNLTGTGLTVPLAGTGTGSGTGTSPAQLTMTPTALTYGSVEVGATATQTVTMSATGASVSISSAASSNSKFTLKGGSFPVTIPAGQSASFDVAFTPTTSGTQSGSVSFVTSAPNSLSVEPLSGVGVQPQYTVGLSWNASSSSDIAGYNIYRALYVSSCGSYSKVNSALNPNTTYTDSTIASGATYCYVTTAVNSGNQESGYSSPAQVSIP